MASYNLPHFPKLPYKLHDFQNIVIQNKICVLIFSATLPAKFLILRRVQRDIIINVIRLRLKYPLFLSDFKETWLFSIYIYIYIHVKVKVPPSSGRREGPRGPRIS